MSSPEEEAALKRLQETPLEEVSKKAPPFPEPPESAFGSIARKVPDQDSAGEAGLPEPEGPSVEVKDAPAMDLSMRETLSMMLQTLQNIEGMMEHLPDRIREELVE